MLDWGTRLDRFDLEGGAYIGEHRGTEGQRLGVVLLPALILGSQIKGARVLQVRWKHNRLVTGLAWELHAKVPGIEGDEDKVEILGREVLGSKGVEAVHGVSEGAGVSHMFPRQGSKARAKGGDGRVDGLDEHAFAVYLVERLGIEQDPAKLDDLGRVLGHVDAMLVARSRNMDNDVSIDMGWWRLLIRHVRKKGEEAEEEEEEEEEEEGGGGKGE